MDGDILQTAKSYWNPARIKQVTGGKKWLLLPDESAPLLYAIGLMNKDASIPWDKMRKYSQVNHMLQLMEDVLVDQAARHEPIHIFDAGCGTSFLSLAMAWHLRNKIEKKFKIVGIDANSKVIDTSNQRAKSLGLEEASFTSGLIPESSVSYFATEDGKNNRPNILIALHACDTATDHAIALGIKDKADVIAVAPCCQRELSNLFKQQHPDDHPLSPSVKIPNIRHDLAATLTDNLRCLILRSHGYEVTATEFVPSEHTPKNRLILAVRRGSWHEPSKQQLQKLTEYIGGHQIKLIQLLA